MAWSYIPARLIGEKTSNFVDRQLEGLGVKNPLVREFGKRLAYVLPAAAVNIALADPVGKALTLHHGIAMNHDLPSSHPHLPSSNHHVSEPKFGYRYDIDGASTSSGHSVSSDASGNYYDRQTGDGLSRW